MLRRLSILLLLASWSFAWLSASVHVHHHRGCNHHPVPAAVHSHDGTTHAHCHSHHGATHRHFAEHQSPDEDAPEKRSSLSGECPLCDLNALELAETPVVEVARFEVCVAGAPLLSVTAPTAAGRYALRGRAPPAC